MKFAQLGIGFVVGIIGTGLAVWMMAPGMMLVEIKSPYGPDKSVQMIQKEMKKLNKEQDVSWVNPDVKPLHKSIKKHGAGDLRPIYLVNLCEPHHAKRILGGDNRKKMSVMMPCTVTVYEKSNGDTYIGYMNAGIMGRLFGGVVAEVMGEVAAQQEEFFTFATK